MEIAEAMSLFKSTRFIFTSPLSADIYEKIEYRNGRKLDLDESENHNHEKLCHCGARFDGIECPKCGNWDF